MTRQGRRERLLDGVDHRLIALPTREVDAAGVRAVGVWAASRVLAELPDKPRATQQAVLAEALDALGLTTQAPEEGDHR